MLTERQVVEAERAAERAEGLNSIDSRMWRLRVDRTQGRVYAVDLYGPNFQIESEERLLGEYSAASGKYKRGSRQ
jgi:hypothetical protein